MPISEESKPGIAPVDGSWRCGAAIRACTGTRELLAIRKRITASPQRALGWPGVRRDRSRPYGLLSPPQSETCRSSCCTSDGCGGPTVPECPRLARNSNTQLPSRPPQLPCACRDSRLLSHLRARSIDHEAQVAATGIAMNEAASCPFPAHQRGAIVHSLKKEGYIDQRRSSCRYRS